MAKMTTPIITVQIVSAALSIFTPRSGI
jgi:hypothetical protein